jgi:hypothetical protein
LRARIGIAESQSRLLKSRLFWGLFWDFFLANYSAIAKFVIYVNQGLTEGASLVSSNGQFTAALQTDGNFVLYEGSSALWATYTKNNTGALHLTVQSDGNVVIYTSGNAAAWATYSFGSNAWMIMQDDGANKALWNPMLSAARLVLYLMPTHGFTLLWLIVNPLIITDTARIAPATCPWYVS